MGNFCDDMGCHEGHSVTADGSGNWATTFTDIEARKRIKADQSDDDWDVPPLYVEWRIPAPWLEANPVHDWVNGFRVCQLARSVDLDINSGAYTPSGVVGVTPWGFQSDYVTFDLSGAYDLQAGDEVHSW